MDRFWAKVEKSDDCWVWRGASRDGRYGAFWLAGKYRAAHRVSWEMHNGPIPAGLEACHACDNTKCVNPAHLWLGTRLDNEQDKTAKGRRPHGPTTGPITDKVRGIDHGAARLTLAQVAEARQRKASGVSAVALAREYGVSVWCIYDLLSGRRWHGVAA